jgi:hypothetical protein
MEVDRITLARWERGEKEPWGRFVEQVKRFLERQPIQKPNVT